MSEKLKLSVTRSTAIASLNAVVNHLKLGLFVSQFDELADSYGIRWGKFATHRHVPMSGRTNQGTWVEASCTVLFKKDRPEDGFPIEKTFLFLKDSSEDGGTYFDCLFSDSGIEVKKLNKSPHYDDDYPWPGKPD